MTVLTTLESDQIIEELYQESSEDIVGLWEVVKLIEDRTGGDADQDQSLQIVRALLDRGMEAGDPPYSPGGYDPWPDQRPDAVLERIRQEWDQLGRVPNIPDIVWFGRPGARDIYGAP